jgi:nicotinamidase-related amidase
MAENKTTSDTAIDLSTLSFAEMHSFTELSSLGIKNLFTEQTWNSNFEDEAKPDENNTILNNRNSYSAYQGADLKSVLEENGVHRLFLMGFLTNASIVETAREIEERMPNISIYVLVDGCAAMSEEEHFDCTGSTLPLFSTTISCSEAQTILRRSPPPSGRAAIGGRIRSMGTSTGSRLEMQQHFRPRILALHGARSNDSVTKLELENLEITEEDYDILYLRGTIEVEEGDPEPAGLVNGPFYSWIDEDENKFGPSLIKSVHGVLAVAETQGPFDGIYGFSSGALVAALVAGIAIYSALRNAILDFEGNELAQSNPLSRFSVANVARSSARASSRLRKQLCKLNRFQK